MNFEAKIRELKSAANLKHALENRLAESDYKIIKCYEYFMVGLETPYDINELHEERESIRV
jgi:hypothetical protein